VQERRYLDVYTDKTADASGRKVENDVTGVLKNNQTLSEKLISCHAKKYMQ
jgi:hypothetical protein